MNDWVGLIFLLLLGAGALVALSRLGKPYQPTAEEFEERAANNPGLLSAGMMGLQKILDPAADKAAEVQQDSRQGFYDGEQESGDGEDTDSTSEHSK
jgi:hypothetical protein